MSKVVITDSFDYADEFDYPVCSIIDTEMLTIIKENMQYFPNCEQEFYFGTNEALYFEKSDLVNLLDRAEPITDEELDILIKFDGVFGLDVVDRIVDVLLEAMHEQGGLEDQIKIIEENY